MPTATSIPHPSEPFRKFIIVDGSTIREARDKQEERRPRKRQRVDSDEEEGGAGSAASPDRRRAKRKDGSEEVQEGEGKSEKPTYEFSFGKSASADAGDDGDGDDLDGGAERDPEYFSADPAATAYIRIEKTIFKIHKDLLSCSEYMTQRLESHILTNGTTSEASPLSFPSATSAEFRAFLWTLHAPASELTASPPPHDQAFVDRLPLLLSLTAKYPAPKLQAWAHATLDATAASGVYMESCASAALAALVEVCVRHARLDTLERVVERWCARLESRATPSVPAMGVADRFADPEVSMSRDGWAISVPVPVLPRVRALMRKLKGVAYYVHIQDMIDRQGAHSSSSGALALLADPKLNNGQVMRLLAGYWSLVSLWERLRLHPPPLPRAPGGVCSEKRHKGRCVPTWERRWVSAVGWRRIMGLSSADVLGLLECLRDQLMGDEELKMGGAGAKGGGEGKGDKEDEEGGVGVTPECRLKGLEALRDLRRELKEGMADHFLGLV